MVSQGFSLNLGNEKKGGTCIKVLLGVICVAVIAGVVCFAIYAFKSRDDITEKCPNPNIKGSILTNWTKSGDKIAISCFPGYFIDGIPESQMAISKCQNGEWIPEAPDCNYLPMKLNCLVSPNKLSGNIQIWQMSRNEKARIKGLIDYSDALNSSKGHLSSTISISKLLCQVEHDFNETSLIEGENNNEINETISESVLRFEYESDNLVVYRNAELQITLVFLSANVASLVSIRQRNVTEVIYSNIPVTTSSERSLIKDWDKQSDTFKKIALSNPVSISDEMKRNEPAADVDKIHYEDSV